jgi:hypothetical protein
MGDLKNNHHLLELVANSESVPRSKTFQRREAEQQRW